MADNITGQVGLGGNVGFEIQQEGEQEPYEVIVKALAKDDTTQEVVWVVMTSRNASASSVLGTGAIDVFHLLGRPHLKDLVVPPLTLDGNTTAIPPVQIMDSNSTSLPDIYAGRTMVEYQFTASKGTEPYSWFSDGLPIGLFLDLDGTLHGTPLSLGSYNINIAVADSTQPSYIATKSFTLNVVSDLSLPMASLPSAQVGTFYSQKVAAVGGVPPYTYQLNTDVGEGALPTGLTVSTDGTIDGWPVTYNSTSDFLTPFTFQVIVTDTLGAEATQNFSITLLPMALTIGQNDIKTAYLNDPVKIAIPIYGGQSPYTLSSFTTDIEQLPILKSPLKVTI